MNTKSELLRLLLQIGTTQNYANQNSGDYVKIGDLAYVQV